MGTSINSAANAGGFIRVALLAIAIAGPLPGVAQYPNPPGPMCSTGSFWVQFCGEISPPGYCPYHSTCIVHQSYSCGTGEPTSLIGCAASGDFGACVYCDPANYVPTVYDQNCGLDAHPEDCTNLVDDDLDGCINNGCPLGVPPCACTARCETKDLTCPASAIATCSPDKTHPEQCGNGEDDNCNGLIDEGCTPRNKCPSGGTAGSDPILLGTASAATEPFTDFSVETLVTLDITRTYSSADTSLFGGAVGIFGRGWHHQWEGWLTCAGSYCTVARGLEPGLRFRWQKTAASLDNTETWDIYERGDTAVVTVDNNNVLVRRQLNGEWILYLTDGSELHFATVCDSCGTPDAYCADPRTGGKARLTKVVDARGGEVLISYDRPTGNLISVSDALGHVLQAYSPNGCTDGAASELRYDGAVVAKYWYTGTDLTSVTEADGVTKIRSYVYFPDGRLQAVRNAADAAIAEFSYDPYTGKAIGVVDARSSVEVTYGAAGLVDVKEYYANAWAGSQRQLNGDGSVVSVSDGCACGPAKTFTWVDRRLVCTIDSLGHTEYDERDSRGRVTRSARYDSQSYACPPAVQSLPASYEEEWRSYDLSKPIAQGVSLPLDVVTATWRKSTLNPTGTAAESYDYDPAPKSIDPAGYACISATPGVGALLCRHVTSGWTKDVATLGVVFERHATFYSYDSRGRLVKTTGPVNLDRPSPSDVTPIEERAYWPDTESSARRGRLWQVKRYASTAAAPLVTTYDYDAFGVYQVTDQNGARTTFVKDGRGRVTFVLKADGRTRETRYYDGLLPRLQLAPSGAVTRISYDGKGRVQTVEHLYGDPDNPLVTPVLGWSEHYSYDPAGNPTVVERRNAQGAVTWKRIREFDVQHRVVKDTHPENPSAVASIGYDASGFLASTTDEQGRIAEFVPDPVNRVQKVRRKGVDATGLPVSLDVATYSYADYQGVLGSITDGKAQATSYVQDDFGQICSLATSSLKDVDVRYAYDARGNVLRRQGGQVTIDFAYDGLNRLLTVSAANAADGETISYTYQYDAPGKLGYLDSVVEPDRTVTYGYDTLGRLASETASENGIAVPFVTGYGYDADGDLDTVVYPGGLQVKYERDAATKQVREVRDLGSGTTYASAITHWPGGPVGDLTLGNGLAESRTFNLRYEPAAIASGPLALGYTMSTAGDVDAIQDGATAYRYGYDFLDRLTSVIPGQPVGETATHGYAYDRIQETFGAGGVRRYAYAYDHQANVSAVGLYDSSGMTIAAALCLKHDALGRLVLVGGTSPAGVSPDGLACTRESDVTQVLARFRYDSQNRRVARWLPATGWTYFVNGPDGSPLGEATLTTDPAQPWSRLRDYVWLDGRPLAQVEYPGPVGSPDGYAYYVHSDHIGLPRALTNQAGQVVWSAAAWPYGDLFETISPDPLAGRTVVTNLRLPGQYDERLLGSLGLQGPYYNWNRWYLPGAGRYLESDPIALRGQLNTRVGVDWYNYAEGNPLNHTDPDGLYTTTGCGRDGVPSEAELRQAAQRIWDTPFKGLCSLRECVLRQIDNAEIDCTSKKHCKGDNVGYADIGSCEDPTHKAYFCKKGGPRCQQDTILHELAHQCGWQHGDGYGVPDNGHGVIPSCIGD